jgi:hypothetical protein
VVRILRSKIANPYGISKLLCNFETRFAPNPSYNIVVVFKAIMTYAIMYKVLWISSYPLPLDGFR